MIGMYIIVKWHVRKFLSIHNQERFCAIFPSRSIKSDWLNRLRDRYEQSLSEKDLRALEHAEKFYDSDIARLWYECQYGEEYYHDVQIIDDINYDLIDLVERLKVNEKES